MHNYYESCHHIEQDENQSDTEGGV